MKKRDYFIAIAVLCVAIVVGLSSVTFLTGQPSSVTWEGVLPDVVTVWGGTEAINVAMTASTVGLDVSEETALTNTVNGTIKSTHTTSGTPANNIGNGYWVLQEAGAGIETVMQLNAVMTDVTGATEDAKFSVELMAAGAATSEVFFIGSTGIVNLDGGATLDNTTSANELDISETTIQLTGIVNVDGGAFTANQDSGDYDFVVETDTVATALVIDGADDSIDFGVSLHFPDVAVTGVSYSLGSVGRAGNMFLVDSSGPPGTGEYGFIIDDSEIDDGRWFCIVDIVDASTNTITVVPDAGTIDGAAKVDITSQFGGMCLIYDGTNYWTTSKDL